MLYKIRQAEEKDITCIYNFICELEEIEFDYTLFSNIFLVNILNKEYHYLVAEMDADKLIGFISCHVQHLLHHCGKVAEIKELFVEEPYRKKGVGSQLINNIEKRLTKEDCLLFEVTAQNKRHETHGFYKQFGFVCSHKKFTKSLLRNDFSNRGKPNSVKI